MSAEPAQVDRLKRWERWAVGLVLVALVAFGGLVLQRSAFLTLRMTDADVFFRAGWAVRHDVDIYRPLSERDWHYVYPQFFAIAIAPLADPITPEQLAARLERRTREVERRAALGLISPARLREAREEIRRDVEELRPVVEGDRGWYVPYPVSVALWYLLSLGSLLLAVHWLARAVELGDARIGAMRLTPAHRGWWTLRLWPLLFCLPSAGNALSRGQVDTLVLLAIAGMALAATKRRSLAAGLWLSVAASIKVIPALLGALAFWRRDWRMLLGAVLGGVVLLVALPAMVVGPARMWEYNVRWMQVMGLPGLGLGQDDSRKEELYGLADNDNQSLKSILHNYSHFGLRRGQRPPDPQAWVRVTAMGLALAMTVVSLWAAGGPRRTRVGTTRGSTCHPDGTPDASADPTAVWVVGLLSCVMIMASPVCHLHYFTFALPLVVALVGRTMREHPVQGLPWWAWLVWGAYASVYVAGRIPGINHAVQDLGLMLLANIALWAAGVVVLSRLVRGEPPSQGMSVQVPAQPSAPD